MTIDDERDDFEMGRTAIYMPQWNNSIWRLGPFCSDYHMTKFIDASQTLYNTWHDCTWSPGTEPFSVTLEFKGENSTP